MTDRVDVAIPGALGLLAVLAAVENTGAVRWAFLAGAPVLVGYALRTAIRGRRAGGTA